MDTGYKKFMEELRNEIIRKSGCREEDIYFVEGGSRPEAKGDRLFWKLQAGDETMDVIAIRIRETYEKYKEGISVDEMTEKFIQEADGIKNSGILKQASTFRDYGKIKKQLILRLMNWDQNREKLQGAVWYSIGDIAAVLYARLGELNGGEVTMKIREEWAGLWGKTRKEIFSDALQNMISLTPPRIYEWNKMLWNEDYEGEEFLDPESGYQINRSAAGNCLSSSIRTNGAAVVLIPEVAERLCRLMGSGIYLVFTSIHEVMVHNEKNVTPEDLQEVLIQTMEETTDPDDRLSNHIYHYDTANGMTVAL